jgi:hypothetical protein
MRTPRPAIALVALLMIGPVPAPVAAAQMATPEGATLTRAQWSRGRAVPRDRFQQVYAQGYRSGIREGERDARDRRGGDYRRHNDYRRAGGWGNRGSGEADAFRRGFAEGYLEGYNARRGGWGAGGYPSRQGPTYPSYPGGGYPGRGGGYGYYSPGAQRGLEDGYRDGLNAARRNQRYDPVGERRYRQGDAGYNRRDGSRDQYKDDYRQAYRQGYDRGFQEGRWR